MRDHGHSSIASRGPHKVKAAFRSVSSHLSDVMHYARARHRQLLGHAQLGDLTSSHLPRASCRRGCQGAARTDRLLAHHGAARLCFSSPHPAPVAEDCSPTSLPAFLAPLAPPHTRRFLGDSLDARLLSRCAPASLQMRANAVFAPILRLAWLLILNMVPGARGLALASMVPRSRRTYIGFHQQPCRPVSHRSLHPPRPPPL